MFNFPWTNFHELNLDWILSVVKEAKEVFDTGRTDIDYAVETADEAKTIATQAAEATIADNSINTNKIQNGAVTGAKLADNSVTTDKIVNRTITGNDIAENTIESYNIQNGTIIGADIADDTIESNNIKNGTIQTVDIKENAITSSLIADGAVKLNQLASNSVNASKIVDATITYAKLASNAKNVHNANYCQFPDGLIIQWGIDTIPAGSVYVTRTFDIPYASANYAIVTTPVYGGGGRDIVDTVGSKTATSITLYIPTAISNDQQISWLAIGYYQ